MVTITTFHAHVSVSIRRKSFPSDNGRRKNCSKLLADKIVSLYFVTEMKI